MESIPLAAEALLISHTLMVQASKWSTTMKRPSNPQAVGVQGTSAIALSLGSRDLVAPLGRNTPLHISGTKSPTRTHTHILRIRKLSRKLLGRKARNNYNGTHRLLRRARGRVRSKIYIYIFQTPSYASLRQLVHFRSFKTFVTPRLRISNVFLPPSPYDIFSNDSPSTSSHTCWTFVFLQSRLSG